MGIVTTPASASALAAALMGSGVVLAGTPSLTGYGGPLGSPAGLFSGADTLKTSGGSPFPMAIASGAVLTTGVIQKIPTPNPSGYGFETDLGQGGYGPLDAVAGICTKSAACTASDCHRDAVVLTLPLVPLGSTLRLSYVFCSMEILGYGGNPNMFNDSFAAFLSDGVTTVNIGTLPGGETVTVSHITPAYVLTPYFLDNPSFTAPAGFYFNAGVGYHPASPIQIDTAVVAGRVYTLTLAVEDCSDGVVDSAVFLGALTSPGVSGLPTPGGIGGATGGDTIEAGGIPATLPDPCPET